VLDVFPIAQPVSFLNDHEQCFDIKNSLLGGSFLLHVKLQVDSITACHYS